MKFNILEILFQILLVGTRDVSATEERLLLNDPDTLIHRLNLVESSMYVLNATLQQVIADNKSLETVVHQQQTYGLQQANTIQLLQQSLYSQATGSTYIRWGRTHCPSNNTELVYSGYAGGGRAAGDYVCYLQILTSRKLQVVIAVECTELNSRLIFFVPKGLHEDIPCALCRTSQYTSTIMTPGKNTCYSGWRIEYHGYLASGHYNQKGGSPFVCVDINPEFVVRGVDGHHGALFYEVLAKCGSLKCPPYVNNYLLTCVVCSK